MPRTKRVIGAMRDIDGIARILTGKSLSQMIKKGWDLWGADALKNLIVEQPPEDPLRGDYELVGVSPSCSDRILRAAYKAKAQEVHPDKPGGSDEAFKTVDEAMDRICQARGIRK